MKTKVMLITTNRRTFMLLNKILQVKINYTYIENVTSHKLLGVIVGIIFYRGNNKLFQSNQRQAENLHFCSK